ncbi:MAG: Na+/H+ antiporter subunit D [Firmicutes bacterium]|nr:Na+/H+ antiporter subunit D [Bacillota bacterium]
MNNLLILPVVLPLLGAIAIFLTRGRIQLHRAIAIVTVLTMLLFSIILLGYVKEGAIPVFSAGDWEIPYGIVFAADIFSALMLTVASIVATAVLLFSFKTMDEAREKYGYYAFFLLVMMGVNGSFLTGDIFNLYVFFEIMLICSYILLSLGSGKEQLRESFKFMVINMLSSTLFLVGVAFLYGVTGTLNLADLAVKVQAAQGEGFITVIAVLFLVVFGTKAAIFPLYFWLPDSYRVPHPAVSALFGGLLTKVGVYVLYRIFTLVFITDPGYTHTLLLVVAAATMVLGIIGAVFQMDMRKLLSYHIISQIGYMIMGLGIFTSSSLAAGVLFIIHNILVKGALFLVAGTVKHLTGTENLKELGGLLQVYPWLGIIFFFAGISLAGAPPFSGFFAKYSLMLAGLESGRYVIVAVSLGVSILTLFSMMKIFQYAFWGAAQDWYEQKSYGHLVAPAAVLVVLSVAMGLGAQWMYELSAAAGSQLLDPSIYIKAVLGA